MRSERGPLLLPEVVRLDDVDDVDGGGEVVVQDFEDRLHGGPGGAGSPHVHHCGEAYLLALVPRYGYEVVEEAPVVVGLDPVPAGGGGEGEERAPAAVPAPRQHRHPLLQPAQHLAAALHLHPCVDVPGVRSHFDVDATQPRFHVDN